MFARFVTHYANARGISPRESRRILLSAAPHVAELRAMRALPNGGDVGHNADGDAMDVDDVTFADLPDITDVDLGTSDKAFERAPMAIAPIVVNERTRIARSRSRARAPKNPRARFQRPPALGAESPPLLDRVYPPPRTDDWQRRRPQSDPEPNPESEPEPEPEHKRRRFLADGSQPNRSLASLPPRMTRFNAPASASPVSPASPASPASSVSSVSPPPLLAPSPSPSPSPSPASASASASDVSPPPTPPAKSTRFILTPQGSLLATTPSSGKPLPPPLRSSTRPHRRRTHSQKDAQPSQVAMFAYATPILEAWFHAHIDYPYPNRAQIAQLMTRSRLTQSQVGNWFINMRMRAWNVSREVRLAAAARSRLELTREHYKKRRGE